jgi:hypothetical protein
LIVVAFVSVPLQLQAVWALTTIGEDISEGHQRLMELPDGSARYRKYYLPLLSLALLIGNGYQPR